MILPSVGAAQPTHGEFDVAAGQFAPAFDPAHIGCLGIAGEEIARRDPRLVARQPKGLAQITVIRRTAGRHAVCQIARAKGHVATPYKDDRLHIGLARPDPSRLLPSGSPAHHRYQLPLLLLPVLVRGLVVVLVDAPAEVLADSGLRTDPQGSFPAF